MHGLHLMLHWSRTQQSIALSSAEAEVNALCKGAQEGLAARNMSVEMGIPLALKLRTDASAAVGILSRQGVGRVKHLQVRQLWMQERIRDEEMKLIKIPRELNPADLMTHHWNEREGNQHLINLKVIRRGPLKRGAPEGGVIGDHAFVQSSLV